MNTLLRLLLIVAALPMLASCRSTTTIHFRDHQPYTAPRLYDGWGAVVLPDTARSAQYVIPRKNWWDEDKFIIQWGRALEIEARARFHNNFAEGTRVLSENTWRQMEQIRRGESITESETETRVLGWEDVPKEDAADTKGKKPKKLTPEEQERLQTLSMWYEDDLNEMAKNPPTMVFQFLRPGMIVEGSRAIVRFQARVVDATTGKIILEQPYTGSSRAMKAASTTPVKAKEMQEAVNEAFTSALLRLMRDTEEAAKSR